MLNEVVFFSHAFLVILFAFGALRLGKEALIVWIALQAILANLFVIKQVTLFGLDVTCSDVYMIGSILCLNLLQEYFGKAPAKKAVRITFYSMIFFSLMALFHLLYLPNSFDTSHDPFDRILSQTPRLLIASLTVFLIAQKVDVTLFALLKKRLSNSPLSIRTFISTSCSQTLDTVLFSFLGLYGIIPSLFHVIFMSLAIKGIMILLSSSLSQFSKKCLSQEAHDSIAL